MLTACDAAVCDLVDAARALLFDALPGIEETVDAKSRVVSYGYGPGYKGMVATVILSRTAIKLGIVRGAALVDPRGLMTGAGKVHLHVPIASVDDLGQPGLKTLLRTALAAWKRRPRDDGRASRG